MEHERELKTGTMVESDDSRSKRLSNLRSATRMASVGCAIVYSIMVLMMAMMFQTPAAWTDYLILVSSAIYLIGLLISFKSEGLGGSISMAYLLIVLIYLFISGIGKPANDLAIVYAGILFFMFPALLNILYWFLGRESEKRLKRNEN
jgi:hypothetical protein